MATGLEKIVKQIQDEALKSANEAKAKAKKEAEQIEAEAETVVAARCATIAAQSKTEVENAISAADSAAQLSKRRLILSAKQEIISDVISEAQESIFKLANNEYFELILKMVGKFSLPQSGEILFSPTDFKRLPSGFSEKLNKFAKGNLIVSHETRNINGGFVLVYGGVEENCSIDALFYAARETLQDKVSDILFA